MFQPTRRKREEQKARRTMRQIGEQLLAERRKGGTLEKGRDLLSVLVRANMDTELPESQRMNDEDVLAREFTSTFTDFPFTESCEWQRSRHSSSQDMKRQVHKQPGRSSRSLSARKFNRVSEPNFEACLPIHPPQMISDRSNSHISTQSSKK